MKALILIIKLLPYIPVISVQTPDVKPEVPAAVGSGTLLIVDCKPGAPLLAEPGDLRGVVGRDGVARISAPAQNQDKAPYKITTEEGSTFELHGTLAADHVLSGVCP